MNPLFNWHRGTRADWPMVPLRGVAALGTGHTPDRTKPEYWDNCTIPWVTAADLSTRRSEFEPLTDTSQHVSRLGVANSSAVVHPADTVMFCRTASVGLLAITDKPMATTQAFVTWTAGPNLLPRYLLYVIAAMRPELMRIAYGSTHLTIYMPDLKALEIPLPPLPEQRRIANFLDDQVSRLEGAALLRKVQIDGVALRGERFADQMLRPSLATPTVPARHLVREVAVGIVVQPAALYTEADDGVPAVRGTDISPGAIDDERLVRLTPAGHAANPRSRLRRSDVLVVRSGRAGAAARVPERLFDCNCIDVVIVRPGPNLDAGYLEHSINASGAQMAIAEHSTGAIQRHFGAEAMRNLPLVPRPLAEQKAIADRLDASRAEHEHASDLLRRSLVLLRERKQSLITAAVTGQFDVSTARGAA